MISRLSPRLRAKNEKENLTRKRGVAEKKDKENMIAPLFYMAMHR